HLEEQTLPEARLDPPAQGQRLGVGETDLLVGAVLAERALELSEPQELLSAEPAARGVDRAPAVDDERRLEPLREALGPPARAAGPAGFAHEVVRHFVAQDALERAAFLPQILDRHAHRAVEHADRPVPHPGRLVESAPLVEDDADPRASALDGP